MAGLLGYLSMLSDDISSIASKTMVTASKTFATSFDDIGLLFDDIATYTKLATIKSTGLVIDDLAAIASFTNETTSDILKKELENANSVEELKENIKKLSKQEQEKVKKDLENIRQTAIKEAKRKAAKRELPIVYKIAIGSLKNKIIIIPIVLILSFFLPWLISPILILGGSYLAFEGVESILEKLNKTKHHEENSNENNLSSSKLEEKKVKGAIKTDFILSFEIIVITLSLVESNDFITKLAVLLTIGFIATVFVYGIVGIIIKLDDVGFYLQEKSSKFLQKIGDVFVASMPKVIKTISIIGTVAMLAVGGGIIAHQLHLLNFLHEIEKIKYLGITVIFLSEIILGLIVGYIIVKIEPIFVSLFKKNKS
ncbi:hypothetical protein CPU12_04485 [Malaciobacter molluscorum LMG 25693]|uniref:MutK protein (DUF808 domain) n=1 Tax=Malaciobacter molluscorum LMG 25693 TaxID=870501 RepID=A0A2G1DJ51_9BACT|nr:DUF808 family protein [Malaciobacter molluscorum]AXX91663.1 putative MutK protein (DUF808 domain) [Malaciobacter molluscorum LMG 25693]PHO18543.1 hypothetical protein CPU12_04485 [Malaciobacter molluscorum LMG 25693]